MYTHTFPVEILGPAASAKTPAPSPDTTSLCPQTLGGILTFLPIQHSSNTSSEEKHMHGGGSGENQQVSEALCAFP